MTDFHLEGRRIYTTLTDVTPIALPPRLLLKEEPVADCGRYDALLGEVIHVTQ